MTADFVHRVDGTTGGLGTLEIDADLGVMLRFLDLHRESEFLLQLNVYVWFGISLGFVSYSLLPILHQVM